MEKDESKKKFVELADPYKIGFTLNKWDDTHEKFLFSKVRVNRMLLPFGVNAYDIGLEELSEKTSTMYLAGFVSADDYIGTIITPRKMEYQMSNNNRLYPSQSYFYDPKNQISLDDYLDMMNITNIAQ